MGKVQGGFSLVALLDGTTINGYLRVENTPLVQRYNKGTSQFVPDFEKLADNKKPVVVAILRDLSSGDVMTPQTVAFKYNGVELAFGEDGLSTGEGMAGTFKKLTDYPVSIGAQSYPMTALQVMKNLVPVSGYDNDRITVSGTVELGGQSIPFNELGTEVVIQESTGNQYDVLVTNDKGSALTEQGESLTEQVALYKDGILVSDMSGYSAEWFKCLPSGDVAMGAALTQAVTTDDVDNVLKLRVNIYQGGTLVASGFDEVTDFSDPYYVNVKITGISGNIVRNGQTATITPVAVKRGTGQEQPELVANWSFNIKDNGGKDFILTGQDNATFQGASCQVSYADMQRAGMGLSGFISATV